MSTRALAKSNPQDRSGFPGWGFKTPAAGTFNYITADRFFSLGTWVGPYGTVLGRGGG